MKHFIVCVIVIALVAFFYSNRQFFYFADLYRKFVDLSKRLAQCTELILRLLYIRVKDFGNWKIINVCIGTNLSREPFVPCSDLTT